MSKLEYLKMIKKIENDNHYQIAEQIFNNQANDDYVMNVYDQDAKIKNLLLDALVKENESTFWSCKLAIMEKQKKIEKINNLKNVPSEENSELDNSDYIDLINEFKADLELLDRDIKTYYSRMRAINRQLKKLVKK